MGAPSSGHGYIQSDDAMMHTYKGVASSLPALLFVLAITACAPLRHVSTPEPAGTPSSTGCDAEFEIGGACARVNDLRFTLMNRSTSRSCLATRVLFLFEDPLRPAAIRVTTPTGWTSREVPCETGGGARGFEWRTDLAGVMPGHALAGFGLTYDQASAPFAKSWMVDLGRRRVIAMIGTAGGNASESRAGR